jgi:hypothetical protein
VLDPIGVLYSSDPSPRDEEQHLPLAHAHHETGNSGGKKENKTQGDPAPVRADGGGGDGGTGLGGGRGHGAR